MSYMIKNGKLMSLRKVKFHFIYAPLLALLLTLLIFIFAFIYAVFAV